MKIKTSIILILLINSLNTYSICSFKGISVWPNESSIHTNSIFILEINTIQNPHFNSKSNEFYLQSNFDKIKLNILKEYQCEFNLNQYLTKPEFDLKPNTEYKLILTSKEDKNECYNSKLIWTTKNKKTEFNSNWIEAPKLLGSNFQSLGCGEIKTIEFSAKLENEMQHAVLVQLEKNNSNFEFFTFVQQGKIQFGKGFHCGEINLIEGQDYQANFKLMDNTGHINHESKHHFKFNETEFYQSSSWLINKENSNYLISILMFNVITILAYIFYNKLNKTKLQYH